MSGRTRFLTVALALGCALCGAVVSGAPSQRPARDESLLLEARAAARRAIHYLERTQEQDGSWHDHPAITALVVVAVVGSRQEGYGPDSLMIRRALDYVRSFAKPDGSISGDFYRAYTTSVCLMALARAGTVADRALIEKGRLWLLDAQADESEGFTPDSPDYGGWGYEPSPSREGMRRADLSNTQFALDALHALEQMRRSEGGVQVEPTGREPLAYDMAIRFLQRCQNLKATNDQPWAGDDGGFVYRPGESKAGSTPEGGLRSYGGMTYAGLKSMVYARLSKDDPRVKATFRWACMHWSLTENPGLGLQGLYYYYMTMAKALDAYGAETIVDSGGVAHDWRVELVDQLLKVQRADGSWVNENGRWMENLPGLVTAYALIALNHATRNW